MQQPQHQRTISDSKFGFEGSKNLKQKILARQDDLKILEQKMDEARQTTTDMQNQQANLSNMLAQKCDQMKVHLEEKFEKIEQDMKKHFAQQKAESSRL